MTLASAFKIAARNASRSTHQYHRLCAILVKGNRILSIGVNKGKSDPLFHLHPELNRHSAPGKRVSKIHAEQDCLNRVDPKDAKGAELIVIRIAKQRGKIFGNASPCSMCRELIREMQIKSITYTDNLGGWSAEKL